ncbi:MAG TPA: ABC transporter permease, partial [Steroidobacteraceae bacterium]|nr:ABC transporter permease [Steroidobacteraceae bacterium]
VYGYITLETLAQLDAAGSLDELQIVSEARTTTDIEAAMRKLAPWLREGGHAVRFIRIPPPGAHPHQWQIDIVSLLLLSFGLLAIVLEAALLSIVIGGLLAPQIRQIAVMKAIGARTSQIAGLYTTLVLVLALAAMSLGLPAGVVAGHWFADFIADLLNFNLNDRSVPAALYGLLVLLGIGVPLCAAFVPIALAARKSVRESIDYFGVSSNTNNRWLQRLCGRVRVSNVGLQLALRNVSRRKSQFALALSLLVLTGSAFMVAGNLLRLWQTITNDSVAEHRFDIRVNLSREEPEAAVIDVVNSIPGVRIAEPARMRWANVDTGDALSFSTRSLPLRAVIPGSDLQALDIESGRWLRTDDRDAVVLNSAARVSVFAGINVGDTIALLVNDKPLKLQVVGIARDTFSPAEASTTPSAFAQVVDSMSSVRAVRVGLQPGTDARVVADAIEETLAARQMPARGVYTKAGDSSGITAHTFILIATLALIVTSVSNIAIAGLASCMSTAVMERTREFGVMRTLGARNYDIQNSIIFEALLIGVVSWLMALVFAIPLTIWIEASMSHAINRPLPMMLSPSVALLWLFGVTLVAIVASVAPAKRAAALTVRQTLAHT